MTAIGRVRPAPATPTPAPGAARWVTVAGVSRDVGTTTMTALLTLAYATHRRYRIIAVDGHPIGGDLGARLSTQRSSGVANVAAAAGHIDSFAALESYLDRSPEGAWAITGTAHSAPEVDQTRQALAAVSSFFALGVLDCGPIGEPIADALLETAQAPLLVAPVTPEGVLRAGCFLDWLSAGRDPHDGWHCAIALVSTTRRREAEVSRAVKLLADRGARVVPVPFDSGLVAGRISNGSVSNGVWEAVQRLSSELLSRAARSEHAGWDRHG